MLTRHLRPAIGLILVMTLILGVIFPAIITGLGASLFRAPSDGSLLYEGKTLIGSRLIGQSFSDPKYFWGRPSATSPQPYNALASGGSNLGPLNPALVQTVKANIDKLHAADPDNSLAIPVELVAASGSGLDPDISPAAAEYQVARIARLRHVPLAQVQALAQAHTVKAHFRVLGPETINVLELNIALDHLH